MRIAIPVFRARISPRFDTTKRLLLLDLEDGQVVSRQEVPFDFRPPLRKNLFLKEQGVEALLCGGIRRCDCFAIEDMGISVYPSLMGAVDDILRLFLDGSLQPGPGTMSGPRRLPERSGWQCGRGHLGPRRRERR